MHRIGRQVFEIEATSSKTLQIWQETLPEIFNTLVQPKLEQELDRLFPAGKYVQIDRLMLDLGTLTSKDLTEALSQKILDQIIKVFAKLDAKPGTDFFTKDTDEVTNVAKLSKAERLWKVFFYFLEKGYFPWNSEKIHTVSAFESELLRENFNKDFIVRLFWGLSSFSEKTAQRLAGIFSESFQLQLCSILIPNLSIDEVRTLLQRVYELNHSWNKNPKDWWYSFWSVLFQQQESPKNLDAIASLMLQTCNALWLTQDFSDEPKLQWIKTWQQSAKVDVSNLSAQSLIKKFSSLLEEQKRVLEKTLSLKRNLKDPGSNQTKQDAFDSALIPQEDQEKLAFSAALSDIPYPENGISKANSNVAPPEHLYHDLIAVEYAGIVLLHPFLETLFNEAGLVEKGRFRSTKEQSQAVLLSAYLVSGEFPEPEWNLLIPKILCNWPLEEPLHLERFFDPQWPALAQELLSAVIGHWSALGQTSPKGLQQNFLQRPGNLQHTSGLGWALQIETNTIDILLQRLPWGISYVKLPWMKEMIQVYWD